VIETLLDSDPAALSLAISALAWLAALARWQRRADPWKANHWLCLLTLLGLQTSLAFSPPWPTLAGLGGAGVLALLTWDAAGGRRPTALASGSMLLGLLLSGVLLTRLAAQPLAPALLQAPPLLLALLLYGRWELQRRPGAGWILLGLLGWGGLLVLRYWHPPGQNSLWNPPILLFTLLCYWLAVEKQLRLSATTSPRDRSPPP